MFDRKCNYVNELIGNYGTFKDVTKCKLFQAYTSFCGSELWARNSNGFYSCYVAWRNVAKRIFNLNYRTHSYRSGILCGHSSVSCYKTVGSAYSECV